MAGVLKKIPCCAEHGKKQKLGHMNSSLFLIAVVHLQLDSVVFIAQFFEEFNDIFWASLLPLGHALLTTPQYHVLYDTVEGITML